MPDQLKPILEPANVSKLVSGIAEDGYFKQWDLKEGLLWFIRRAAHL